jgi:integrase
MSVMKRTGPKGTKWGVKVTVQGKQRWLGTFDSHKDAKRAEREAMLRAVVPNEKDITCDEFVQKWPTLRPRPRAATNDYNRYALAKFAKDFKGVGLREVTAMRALTWAQENKWRYNTVRAMFHDAVRLGLVEKNVFASLGMSKSKGRRDITPLTAEEVQKLADCAVDVYGEVFGSELRSMILFAAYTGCRWGECCALTWDDVDLTNGEVTISKTISNDNEVLETKTGKARRIVLSPIAAEALRSIPRHLHRSLVFAAPRGGTYYKKSTWHYYWNPIRVKFGKPKYNFHELRHYNATWLVYTLGLPPLQAAAQLGHSDAKLIISLYAHADEQKQRDEIKRAMRKPPKDVTSLDEHRKKASGQDSGEE